MAGAQTSAVVVVEGGGNKRREYRKGNWTLHETIVMIEAKKMDNERRMRRESEAGRMGSSSSSSSRPSELRWKWVEDYCWRYGCNRSQNQCNDKWDNLMRDYKKVRCYEMRVGGGGGDMNSYWKLERNERKKRNLPSNFLPQVFEALFGVVSRSVSNMGFLAVDRQISSVQSLPLLMQQQYSSNPAQELLPPLSLPVLSPLPPHAQVLPTLDSGGSEYSTSPPRKRRRRRHELGSIFSKSAAILAEALEASEEKEEMRHKDLVSIKEKKLKVEESNAEISALAMGGLVNAINKLATSILGLVSERQQRAPK